MKRDEKQSNSLLRRHDQHLMKQAPIHSNKQKKTKKNVRKAVLKDQLRCFFFFLEKERSALLFLVSLEVVVASLVVVVASVLLRFLVSDSTQPFVVDFFVLKWLLHKEE
jgi:hypothetical protein